MSLHVGYEPAGAKCATGPQPGARAIMAWYLGAYADDGGTNLGIYNCRPVRGGTAGSLHGDGRAFDFGVRPLRAGWATVLADALREHSGELGIQCLIWNRRIWSGSYPTAGWRPYTGQAAHYDHIHGELTWAAARSLTAARVQQVIGAGGEVVVVPGASSGAGVLREGTPDTARTAVLQRTLRRWYPHVPLFAALLVDGRYGPATTRAVREFQRRAGLAQDGIAGPATLGRLGIK